MRTITENRLEEIILRLGDFLLNNTNVQFAVIFGSYVRGKLKKNSDLDIAIYFKSPPEGLALLHLINTLSDLSGKEVDLVVLNNASALLRHQVMKYGIPLVIKDSAIYSQFREKTIADYDEYKYVSGMSIYD